MLLPTVQPLQALLYYIPTPTPTEFLDAPNPATIVQIPWEASPLVTGITFYVVGFAALTAWENIVVPKLKLNSILPDVPLLPGEFTQKEIAERWITPEMADSSLPPPSLEQLKERKKHFVGKSVNIRQFISCEKCGPLRPGIVDVSAEWTRYYEEEIFIYKERE